MSDPERPDNQSTDRIFKDDARFALGRIAIFQYVSVGVFLFLIAGFWVLQIREHEANSSAAERNRIKTVPLLAPRGKILDRDGRVIVDNQPAFLVQLTQENLKLEHLAPIAEGLHLDLDELKATVKRYAAGKRYSPIPIKRDLTPAELTFIDSHRDPGTFPELEMVQEPRRLYPQDGLAAHVIGYVGEVSEAQLNTSEFANYSQGDLVGKSGLEEQYNSILKGVDGQRRVVVDVAGREHEVLESIEATPGQNLQLTIDLDLQAVAELALEGKKGAVVALDPRDGSVLAMVSRPAFDPNLFAAHIKAADWKALTSNPDNPLLNRAIQAQFAPGSTFKPLVAMAGLETGTVDENFSVRCSGGANFYGRYTKCWQKGGHGGVNMHAGIVHSCDVYFYTVGDKIGIDGIAEYAQMAGVGVKTGIDLPGEAEGLMPSSKWKLRTQRDKWYAGETISVAIGQGAITLTPIQLATAIGGMANGSVWFKPHLVKPAAPPEAVRRGNWNVDNIAKVVSGMYGVVNEGGGTGTSAAIPGITVSGKTGSAQRISNDLRKSGKLDSSELKDNGWFVAFAPEENPEIVIAVLYEGGEHGGLAAPTARDVIKAYFDKKTRLSKLTQPSLALIRRPQ